MLTVQGSTIYIVLAVIIFSGKKTRFYYVAFFIYVCMVLYSGKCSFLSMLSTIYIFVMVFSKCGTGVPIILVEMIFLLLLISTPNSLYLFDWNIIGIV